MGKKLKPPPPPLHLHDCDALRMSIRRDLNMGWAFWDMDQRLFVGPAYEAWARQQLSPTTWGLLHTVTRTSCIMVLSRLADNKTVAQDQTASLATLHEMLHPGHSSQPIKDLKSNIEHVRNKYFAHSDYKLLVSNPPSAGDPDLSKFVLGTIESSLNAAESILSSLGGTVFDRGAGTKAGEEIMQALGIRQRFMPLVDRAKLGINVSNTEILNAWAGDDNLNS